MWKHLADITDEKKCCLIHSVCPSFSSFHYTIGVSGAAWAMAPIKICLCEL